MRVAMAIAIGGALGALSRYAVSEGVGRVHDLHGAGTFVANILGAFVLGAVVGLTEERWELSEPVRAGITVGVLGAFTTFSTYMYDVVHHAEGERWATSALMLVATIVVGLLAMVSGLAVGRAG